VSSRPPRTPFRLVSMRAGQALAQCHLVLAGVCKLLILWGGLLGRVAVSMIPVVSFCGVPVPCGQVCRRGQICLPLNRV